MRRKDFFALVDNRAEKCKHPRPTGRLVSDAYIVSDAYTLRHDIASACESYGFVICFQHITKYEAAPNLI